MFTDTDTLPEWAKTPIRIPLKQAFPEFESVREYRNRFCIFNSDRSQLINVVSPRYQLIPHRELLETVEEAMTEEFGECPVPKVRSVNGSARIRAEIAIPGGKPLPIRPMADGKIDKVKPHVRVLNSYDSTWPFSIGLGAYRLVCSNGMVIGQRFGGYDSKHYRGKLNGGEIRESIRKMIAGSSDLVDCWNQWYGDTVTYTTAEDIADTLKLGKKHRGWLYQDRFPMTVWDLYNACTATASHEVKSFNRRVELDNAIAEIFYTRFY